MLWKSPSKLRYDLDSAPGGPRGADRPIPDITEKRSKMPQNRKLFGMPEWCARENSQLFDTLPSRIWTDDGIRCSELERNPNSGLNTFSHISHPSITLFANSYSRSVTDYLVTRSELWPQAAIRVVGHLPISSSAPMFGVSLQRAIEQLKSRDIVKSEFYLPNQSDDVFYDSLLLHIKSRKQSNGGGFALEAWQYCPEHPLVFYLSRIARF